MQNFSFKKLIGGGITRAIIISLFATLACVGIIKAATTIGNNITTGGTLNVSGASTLTGNTNVAGSLATNGTNTFYGATSIGGALTATSTLDVSGLTTLGNASTTLLSVSSNSWLATTTISGDISLSGDLTNTLTLGSNLIVNGAFDTDSDWNKGSGWSISGGNANASAATGNLVQSVTTIQANRIYRLKYSYSTSDGSYLGVSAGGWVFEPLYSQSFDSPTTIVESFRTTNTSALTFIPGTGSLAFTGTLDSVELVDITNQGIELTESSLSLKRNDKAYPMLMATADGKLCWGNGNQYPNSCIFKQYSGVTNLGITGTLEFLNNSQAGIAMISFLDYSGDSDIISGHHDSASTTYDSWIVKQSGQQRWGSGYATHDVQLRRSSANTLTISASSDSTALQGGNLRIGDKIIFSDNVDADSFSGNEVALRRTANGQLTLSAIDSSGNPATGGNFVIGGQAAINTSVSGTANLNMAGTDKTGINLANTNTAYGLALFQGTQTLTHADGYTTGDNSMSSQQAFKGAQSAGGNVTWSSAQMNNLSLDSVFSDTAYNGTTTISNIVDGIYLKQRIPAATVKAFTLSELNGLDINLNMSAQTGGALHSITTYRGSYLRNSSVGSGITLTSRLGYVVDDLTGATNNTNICVGSCTTGNYSIYNSSTKDNYFAGKLGIASSTPWRTLSVDGTVAFNGLTTSNTGNAVCITTSKEITDAGAASCVPSALQFKKDISEITSEKARNIMLNIEPVEFTRKDNNQKRFGFIADWSEKLDKRLIEYKNGNGEIWSFDYMGYTSVITKFVQDFYADFQRLVARVSGLEDRMNRQQIKIEELEKRLDVLEK